MLSLNNVKANAGSRKTSKRVGRWNASWKWTFCGRGMNGQNSRSGGGTASWFEWGQTPLFRRMPKLKWFSNSKFTKEYNIVNLSDLEVLSSKWITEVNKDVLLANKVIRNKNLGVKLLAKGDLKSKLTVVVDMASATAKEAVEKAWGKIETK